MSDSSKAVHGQDINPDRLPQGRDRLEAWSEERAQQYAAQEGIDLTDEHWVVVYCLREYYRLNGPPGHGRELEDMLNNRFSTQGGRKYLRRPFPNGPVAQGMRIAGLPVPAHTEDAGFGTSR